MSRSGRWTTWVSNRFLTGRRGGRGRLVFLFSVVLICAGVATLNTILAVMNGLQQGYIRSILEIGSYHLRWTPDIGASGENSDGDEVADIIAEEPGVLLAVPFREGQTMLNGVRPRPVGALLRGVPETLYIEDKELAKRLDIVDGDFDVSDSGIVLGDELALELGVSPGDSVGALDLGAAGLSSSSVNLTVTGLFRCGYREYEAGMAFVSVDTSEQLFGPTPLEVGVKLTKPEKDRSVINNAVPRLTESGGSLSSWRETNRSFFGALRTEKLMMLLLLALIFVVVSVNIDHSLRRMATERMEDLSLLKAVGATPKDVRILFLRHGLVIGGTGGLTGSVLGVLLGGNVDSIIRSFRWIRGLIFGYFSGGAFGTRPVEAFFRNSEVMAGDVVVILILAVGISSLAAFRAAAMAARLKPAEVLRSE